MPVFMLFVAFSSSFMLLFQGHVACYNFALTGPRVQRKSLLQLVIRASSSWHVLAQNSFQLAPKTC